MGEIKKEELDKLRELKGGVRGAVFQTDSKYVLEREGKEGLEKLAKKLKEWGHPIDYLGIKALDWYPLGLRIISLLAIKETFNLSDKEIREMGKTAPKFSFIVKFLFKLFHPLSKLVQEIPRYWKEHYNIGELQVIKFDQEQKEMVLRLIGFQLHPLCCLYLEGYLERVLQFIEVKANTRETKCTFLGHPYHEYIFNWK